MFGWTFGTEAFLRERRNSASSELRTRRIAQLLVELDHPFLLPLGPPAPSLASSAITVSKSQTNVRTHRGACGVVDGPRGQHRLPEQPRPKGVREGPGSPGVYELRAGTRSQGPCCAPRYPDLPRRNERSALGAQVCWLWWPSTRGPRTPPKTCASRWTVLTGEIYHQNRHPGLYAGEFSMGPAWDGSRRVPKG